MGLTLKSMGLHLKNFMKIKTPRPKNSILFYSTPKGILSFYDLPLKNSMVLQLGDGAGGELQYPLIPQEKLPLAILTKQPRQKWILP